MAGNMRHVSFARRQLNAWSLPAEVRTIVRSVKSEVLAGRLTLDSDPAVTGMAGLHPQRGILFFDPGQVVTGESRQFH